MKLSFPEHHLVQLLQRYDNQHLPLDLFLNHYFRAHKALGANDRRLIADAVYGMARWRLLLDHVVGERVTWEKRYLVYKQFQPENYLNVHSIPLHVRVSCPKELFDRLCEQYGKEQGVHLAQVSNTQAPTTIRINPLKTTRDRVMSCLDSAFEVSLCQESPFGIRFKKRAPLVALPEFKQGLFEIQDEASQLGALMVNPQPGDHVMDYCAGSGGKTLAFAHQMKGHGQIYLHDIRPMILTQARKRLKKAGIQNAQVLESYHPHLVKLKKRMDWVLVDAPCSGTGTLRRNPDQKWKFDSALLENLVGEQRSIFEKALSFVRPGGKIVYATCSLLREENEQQLAHFLETYDLKLVKEPFHSLPSFEGKDGFFAAVMQKS